MYIDILCDINTSSTYMCCQTESTEPNMAAIFGNISEILHATSVVCMLVAVFFVVCIVLCLFLATHTKMLTLQVQKHGKQHNTHQNIQAHICAARKHWAQQGCYMLDMPDLLCVF